MPDSVDDRQLLMAILAAYLGFVPDEVVCDAVAAVNAGPDVSLARQLDLLGNLSSRQIRLLEDLADERLAQDDQQVWQWCARSVSPSLIHLLRERGLGTDAGQSESAVAGSNALNETVHGENTPDTAGARFELRQEVTEVAPPDRYRIVRELAQGGLGTVSVAEDLPLEREVAFKEIRPEQADDERSQSRFLLEAQVTGRLEHPSIVPVYDVGARAEGRPFYVMRLIHGESLKEVLARFYKSDESTSRNNNSTAGLSGALRRERNIEFRDLLSRFVDVCQAVEYAHQHGVIHRDLKPANIMLGKFGETLLVDWGLAKVLGMSDPIDPDDLTLTHTESATPNLTVAGMAIGTPSYMSPEQASGAIHQITPASDIYGLGATLFAIITGRRPVTGNSTAEVIDRVRHGRLEVHEESAPPSVPAALWSICRKAMRTEAGDRYASAAELTRDIERYLADEPVSALKEPIASRARRWIRHHSTVVSTASAICLMAIISLGIGLTVFASLSNRLENANGQLAESNTQLEDANVQLTETNRQLEAAVAAEHLARANAEQSLQIAASSVDTYLSQVTDNLELQRPDLSSLRASLLTNAIPFFMQFEQQAPGDVNVEFMRGKSLVRLAAIHKELALSQQAQDEIERAVEVLKGVVEQQPQNYDYLFHLAVAQNNLGTVLMDLARHDLARQALEETLETRKRIAEVAPENLDARRDRARTLTNLGIVSSDEGDFKAAISLHEQALAIRQSNLQATDKSAESIAELSNSYQNLGLALMEDSRLDEGFEALQTSVNLHEESHEILKDRYEWRSAYGLGLDNLANAFISRGEFDLALQAAGKSVDVFSKLDETYPQVPDVQRRLANTMLRHATILAEVDPSAEPVAEGVAALEILGRIREAFRNDHAFQADLAHAYYSVGRISKLVGQFETAQQQLEQAVQLLQPFIDRLPEDSMEQLIMIDKQTMVLSERASALSYSGDHATAAALYKEVAQRRKHLGEFLADKLAQLGGQADAIANAAMEDNSLENNAEARAGFEQAIQLRTALLQEYPDDSYLLAQQATTHNGLAILFGSMEDYDACRQQYERCIALCDQLIATDTAGRLDSQVTAAGAECNLANLEVKLGNAAAAKEQFDRAAIRLEETLAQQAGHSLARQFLTTTMYGRAALLDHRGEFAEAAHDWHRATEVCSQQNATFFAMFESLSRVKAGEVEAAIEIADANADFLPDLKYMAAKVYALAATQTEDESSSQVHLDAAISALLQLEQVETFVLASYLEDLKSNPDFNALREQVKFIELLERLASK